MKIIKKTAKDQYKLSLILLDWSVRESFHLLHYLQLQEGVEQDDFEVVFLEYHSRVSPGLQAFSERLDQWILLEMPANLYYHKHLMYNVGLALCRGEKVVICDSDAMVKPTFIHSILQAFEDHPGCVLHLDQFRNNRRDLHPFNYPSIQEVTGKGCINWADGKTKGMASSFDALHNRNYGACFCARREDLLAIGGADEHVDYVGHICGPYDMTFRLGNYGLREFWHPGEFLYHTWHPGQAGEDNYLAPHDGRHMALASLEALQTGRVEPLVENRAVGLLRRGAPHPEELTARLLIDERYYQVLDYSFIQGGGLRKVRREQPSPEGEYRGFFLRRDGLQYLASPIKQPDLPREIAGRNFHHVRVRIDQVYDWKVRLVARLLLLSCMLAALPYLLIGRYWPRAADMLPGGRPTTGLMVRLRNLRAKVGHVGDQLCIAKACLGSAGGNARRTKNGRILLMIVERRYKKMLLQVLAWLKIMPSIPITVVHCDEDMSWALDRLTNGPEPASVLLTREIYLNYHIILNDYTQKLSYALV